MKFDKFTVLFLTKSFGGLAQLVRASASHAEGQRFETILNLILFILTKY